MADGKHILAIDVGNTRAKFGLFRKTSAKNPEPLEIAARILNETADVASAFHDWWLSLGVDVPSVAMVAASDPETRDLLLQSWPIHGCRPITIFGFSQIPVGVDVDFPERVGVDRLLNALAGSRMSETGRPVIVVDSGTATTVDLVTSDATFRGGSILPGLRLSAHAMHDYTARLPLLNVDEELTDLPSLPGRNTEAAMRAGLFVGQLGAVKELIARLSLAAVNQFAENNRPEVFVSGGGGRQLVSHLENASFVDSLPLHGLAMLNSLEL